MTTLGFNRRANFEYALLDKYEAGLILTGAEVKSVKTGHISLKESFVTIKGNELFLTNANIPPYKHAGDIKNYDPTRSRKLLLRKSEIKHLIGKSRAEGLTLVPIRVYTKKHPARNAIFLNKPGKTGHLNDTIKESINFKKHNVAGGLLKLEFAVGKGKKKFDKRETIKKREEERKIKRRLKI